MLSYRFFEQQQHFHVFNETDSSPSSGRLRKFLTILAVTSVVVNSALPHSMQEVPLEGITQGCIAKIIGNMGACWQV